jgi:hypothetical protein
MHESQRSAPGLSQEDKKDLLEQHANKKGIMVAKSFSVRNFKDHKNVKHC